MNRPCRESGCPSAMRRKRMCWRLSGPRLLPRRSRWPLVSRPGMPAMARCHDRGPQAPGFRQLRPTIMGNRPGTASPATYVTRASALSHVPECLSKPPAAGARKEGSYGTLAEALADFAGPSWPTAGMLSPGSSAGCGMPATRSRTWARWHPMTWPGVSG
jgi:hypothetical protein